MLVIYPCVPAYLHTCAGTSARHLPQLSRQFVKPISTVTEQAGDLHVSFLA